MDMRPLIYIGIVIGLLIAAVIFGIYQFIAWL